MKLEKDHRYSFLLYTLMRYEVWHRHVDER